MSYYIELQDAKSHEVLEINEPHYMRGCNFQLGGSTELSLSVTYNYSSIFKKVMGEKGIRNIDGKTGQESIKILSDAILKLKDNISDNYWDATEGNAKRSLQYLKTMAEMRPDGIWWVE